MAQKPKPFALKGAVCALAEPTTVASLVARIGDAAISGYRDHVARGILDKIPVHANQLPPLPIDVGHAIQAPVNLPSWGVAVWDQLIQSEAVVLHVLGDIAALTTPVSLAFPVLRLVNWLFLNKDTATNVREILKGSEHIGLFEKPDQTMRWYAPLASLWDLAGPDAPLPTDLPAHVGQMMDVANRVGVMRGTADNLHAGYTNEIARYNRDLGNRRPIRVFANSEKGFEKVMAEFAPEFSFQRHSFHHPHPECHVARRVGYSFLLSEAQRLGKPVVLLAGSAAQAAQTANLVHNHCPELDGRDTYRHNHAYDRVTRQHSAAISCKHTLQECPHRFPGTTLLCPLSTQDIHVRDVIRSMIANDQKDGVILMHLPVPFLDKRVTNYTDDTLNVKYERRDGRIAMYHIANASAGYFNSEETMLSWVRPLPVFAGYNVTLEVLRSVGSMYVLHMRVNEGAQASYPTMWRISSGKFYILPLLKPWWRKHADEDEYFVVPANRFDNVAKFAALTPPGKNSYAVVGNKVKGQEAEIKVADKTIMPRWTLSSDEFNSVVTHALLKAEMMRRDHEICFDVGYSYLSYWYARMDGSVIEKMLWYWTDLVTFQGVRKTRRMFDLPPLERLMRRLTAAYMVEGKMDDPYGEHGTYRVWHGEERSKLDTYMAFVTSKVSGGLPGGTQGAPQPSGPPQVSWSADPKSDNYDELSSFYAKVDARAAARKQAGYLPDEFFWAGVAACRKMTTVDVTPAPSDQQEVDQKGDEAQPEAVVSRALTPPAVESEGLQSRGAPPTVASSVSASTLETTDTDRAPDFYASLPRPRTACTLYQVAEHTLDDALVHHGTVCFKGPISFQDPERPTPSQEQFSQRFSSKRDLMQLAMAGEFAIVPAPDRGCMDLVNTLLLNNPGRRVKLDLDVHDLKQAQVDNAMKTFREDSEEEELDRSEGLVKLITDFFDEVATKEPLYRKPDVVLNGIPASAKSTLARLVCKGRKTLVVVPSRKLAREWQALGDGLTTVTTQHRLPSVGRFEMLIIDEVNLLSKSHVKCWLTMARSYKVKHIICIGDQYQRGRRDYEDVVFGEAPLNAPTVTLTNSFGMPLDAMTAFCRVNGLHLNGNARTLSKVRRSVVIMGRTNPEPTEFPGMELYSRARLTAKEVKDAHGRVMPSVTQSQGARCTTHYFTSGLPNASSKWLSEMLAIQSVLFSRHLHRLVIDMHPGQFTEAFPNVPIETINVINGKSQSKLLQDRPFRPFDLDIVSAPYAMSDDDPRWLHGAVPLESSLQYGERFVSVNADPDPVSVESDHAISNPISMRFATEVLLPRTQITSRRDFKEDLDLIAEVAHGLISCGELGFGDEPRLKSHIPGVFALGDIQMARDRYHDLRNVLLRQLNEKKRMFITSLDVADAKVIFDRYMKTFCKAEYAREAVNNHGYDYLVTRTNAFVSTWNDPFGTSASDLARNAFLKTQVKVKPGLNGAETHGQTIIANSPAMTNFFGPWARLGYIGMNRMDRDDFITDTGFSDEELSQLMVSRGIGARIEKYGNMQIDLTRQDSTHRPAHVIAYCMFLEYCGVPTHVTELYLKLRSMAYVKSLAQNLYKAIIHWNLGSGDPFTLNANCFMMKSSVATRFDGLEHCAGLQKGDDFICSKEGFCTSMLGDVYRRLDVTMKVDLDLPPYHAGRFIVQGALLADPVRAFFRHFSKPHDPATPLEDIWRSFSERRVNYTEEQATFLKKTIPLFYREVSGEEASYIVDVILSLRSFKIFRSTYKYADREPFDIYSPQQDCAYLVAKRLAPNLANATLRKFRNHVDPLELANLYREYGIPVVVCAHPAFCPAGFIGAVVSSSHVYARLAPTPTY